MANNKIKHPVWNVYVRHINNRTIGVFNIFDHVSFNESCIKAYKKYKDKEAFSKEIKSCLMYYFWSKYEWEIVIDTFPPSGEKTAIKIDVYDQVNLNLPMFIDYLWNYYHS